VRARGVARAWGEGGWDGVYHDSVAGAVTEGGQDKAARREWPRALARRTVGLGHPAADERVAHRVLNGQADRAGEAGAAVGRARHPADAGVDGKGGAARHERGPPLCPPRLGHPVAHPLEDRVGEAPPGARHVQLGAHLDKRPDGGAGPEDGGVAGGAGRAAKPEARRVDGQEDVPDGGGG